MLGSTSIFNIFLEVVSAKNLLIDMSGFVQRPVVGDIFSISTEFTWTDKYIPFPTVNPTTALQALMPSIKQSHYHYVFPSIDLLIHSNHLKFSNSFINLFQIHRNIVHIYIHIDRIFSNRSLSLIEAHPVFKGELLDVQ